MECCKMIASIYVVFIHVEFPGTLNGLVNCLSCFAVPIFFAISGYFNYGADHETLTRRLKHILRLYLTAILVNLIWGCFVTEYRGGSTIAYLHSYLPDLEEIAQWLIFQLDPRMGQLWYLASLCLCYGVLRIYVRFFGEKPVDYRPLYVASFCLFSIFFAFGMLAPALGVDLPYPLYRNGYFMGLPVFTLGIFLRAYQDRILTNFHLTSQKQVLLILTGILLGLLQWRTMGMGQITFGSLLEVVALMLFLGSHPRITAGSGVGNTLIAKLGIWSTYIYLFHMIMLQFYQEFCETFVAAALPEREPYLRPVFVAALSLLAAVVFERGAWLINRVRRRR
ncbi:MAG: acyltransferase [Faecousia sp.]